MLEQIEINPNICAGKPVIRGTRIPITVILDQLSSGESWESVLHGFPELKNEDIKVALEYAKSSIEHTEFFETEML